MTHTVETKYKEIKSTLGLLKKIEKNDINHFLDEINKLKNSICGITKLIDELDSDILEESEKDKHSVYDEISLYRELILKIKKVMILIKKSEFYPGIKTSFAQMKSSLSNLEESINDIAFYFESDNDKEFAEIFSKMAS